MSCLLCVSYLVFAYLSACIVVPTVMFAGLAARWLFSCNVMSHCVHSDILDCMYHPEHRSVTVCVCVVMSDTHDSLRVRC
jgi:hypothetical protein